MLESQRFMRGRELFSVQRGVFVVATENFKVLEKLLALDEGRHGSKGRLNV